MILRLVLFLLVSPAAWASNCLTGNFTIQNQPPDDCIPFTTNGIFHQQIPGAGSGGPLNHLYPNSDAIIRKTMTGTDMGVFRVASTGNYHQDILGEPIYYGRASDPVYKVTSCDYTGPADPKNPNNPVGHIYHIPDRATFSNSNPTTGAGFSDMFLVVWDQVSNQVLGAYNYSSPNVSLPHCTSTDPAHPCATPAWRGCVVDNWSTGKAYQVRPGATGALSVPGWALAIRTNEWMRGTINHAIYLNTGCEASPGVFPQSPGVTALICADQTNRPHEGNLVFLDYTDAQINALNLPPWQKAIIAALTHYGGYIGDTFGGPGPINASRFESNQAYALAGLTNPLYAWLDKQSGVIKNSGSDSGSFTYTMSTFGGIPNVMAHLHIADPCVALGMAGLPGGCSKPSRGTLRSAPKSLTHIAK